jgi:hypothetical protein
MPGLAVLLFGCKKTGASADENQKDKNGNINTVNIGTENFIKIVEQSIKKN